MFPVYGKHLNITNTLITNTLKQKSAKYTFRPFSRHCQYLIDFSQQMLLLRSEPFYYNAWTAASFQLVVQYILTLRGLALTTTLLISKSNTQHYKVIRQEHIQTIRKYALLFW